MASLQSRILSLQQTILSLEEYVPYKHVLQQQVSTGSVGWHLQHSALVLQNILQALVESDSALYRPQSGFWKTVVLLTGRIPRGRARAPKRSVPPALLDADDDVRAEIKKVVDLLPALKSLPANAHFLHPVFGPLNLREAIKLMSLHTKHHKLIMQDIVRAASKA